MSESLRFLSEVNAYLDSIDEAGDFRAERLEKLLEYKTEMLAFGFNAPFSAMMAQAKEELDEPTADENTDLRKQSQRARYVASLKKFSLNRVRVACAAHQVARALTDRARPELVALLPLGGSYRRALFAGGEAAVEAYRKLISLLQQRRFNVQGASAVVSLVQDGQEVERSIELGEGVDAKAQIKKMFGAGAQVKNVMLKRKSVALIKNYSTKVALFTVAALDGAHLAKQWMDEEEAKDERLVKYNSILRKHGLSPDVVLVETERFENVKKEAQEAGFLTRVKGEWKMEEGFISLLHSRRARRRRLAMDRADGLVYSLLQWYYIVFNSDARKAYGAMPSVLAEPDEEQLSVLTDLAPSGYPLAHGAKVIHAKLVFEKAAPPLPSRAWGPAFVCVRGQLPASWAATEFGVKEEEIAKAMPMVKSLVEKPTGRGAAFIADLKKGKSEPKK
ncbi:MAG: DUF530 family protein [Candidatus Micrarchaeota archaeon]|nr:DUF530 family protein [Candidatus Micrarchaeota archaeon]